MKRIALTLVLSSALLGLGTVTMAQDSPPVAPDNSAVNVRDRNPDAMTAGQQSNAKSDVELTRRDTQSGGQRSFTFDAGS